MHWECKYCDSDFRPIKVEGDLVCEFCGANGKMQKFKLRTKTKQKIMNTQLNNLSNKKDPF